MIYINILPVGHLVFPICYYYNKYHCNKYPYPEFTSKISTYLEYIGNLAKITESKDMR